MPSSELAAIVPLFPVFEGVQDAGEQPTIDDVICYLRWKHPEMVETLDDRMRHQRELVTEILLKRGMKARELFQLTPREAEELDDPELRLCYHVLRDIAYIDSLR